MFSRPVRADFRVSLLPFLNVCELPRGSNGALLQARIPDVLHPWCPDATFRAVVPTAFPLYLHAVFLTDVERLRCFGWMRGYSVKSRVDFG